MHATRTHMHAYANTVHTCTQIHTAFTGILWWTQWGVWSACWVRRSSLKCWRQYQERPLWPGLPGGSSTLSKGALLLNFVHAPGKLLGVQYSQGFTNHLSAIPPKNGLMLHFCRLLHLSLHKLLTMSKFSHRCCITTPNE